VAEAFGVRGLNGIDFVARGGAPLPVEVNPRWSSSMELFDREERESLLAAHVGACRAGLVSWRSESPGSVAGKAIVFARRAVVLGETSGWLASRARRDVPWPGQRVAPGEPVCTVYARASSYATCYASLVEQAAAVYRELEVGCPL
jgi:predicted ATP-grasp superfamily ATP-dependent carboligase